MRGIQGQVAALSIYQGFGGARPAQCHCLPSPSYSPIPISTRSLNHFGTSTADNRHFHKIQPEEATRSNGLRHDRPYCGVRYSSPHHSAFQDCKIIASSNNSAMSSYLIERQYVTSFMAARSLARA